LLNYCYHLSSLMDFSYPTDNQLSNEEGNNS
jgi:hypothetical protein